jgi:hypothetical protein
MDKHSDKHENERIVSKERSKENPPHSSLARTVIFIVVIFIFVIIFGGLVVGYNKLKTNKKLKAEIMTLQQDFEVRFKADQQAFNQKWDREITSLKIGVEEKVRFMGKESKKVKNDEENKVESKPCLINPFKGSHTQLSIKSKKNKG